MTELLAHPQERRLTMVANLGRFRTWGMCEALIDRSREELSKAPEQAADLAELAVAVVNSLDRDSYRAFLISDLAAEAWLALAAARRECSNVEAASAALEAAEGHRLEGSGDPLLEAETAFVGASIRGTQLRFTESSRLFEKAESLWQQFAESGWPERAFAEARAKVLLTELLAASSVTRRALVKEARFRDLDLLTLLVEQAKNLVFDDPDSGVECAHLAVSISSHLEVYGSAIVADHNGRVFSVLGNALRAAGDLPGAEMALGRARAQVALSQGDSSGAATVLEEVRRVLFARQVPYEGAVATLELAAIRIEQGRTDDVKRLIAEALPIFEALHVECDALAALILLRRAVEQGAVTVTLLETAVAVLRKTRGQVRFAGDGGVYATDPRVVASTATHQRQGSALGRKCNERELLSELRAKSYTDRIVAVRSDCRYHTRSVCEAVVECAREAAYDDASLAIEWGELAVLATSRLDPNRYVASLVADLRGRAWVALANAKRVGSDLRGAEASFAEAQAELDRGTGDPLDKAPYYHYLSTLRLAQRRLPEAIRCIDHAIAIYRRIGDQHLEGRSLVLKAVILQHDGDLEAAIRLDEKALGLIDPHRDSRLQLAALHNLALKLASHGQAERARRVLTEARPMYERFGDKISLIKLRWLEARIAVATDNLSFAEASLNEARDAFLARDLPYEAGLIALELAALYLEQGRTADVKGLVAEMMPIFKALAVQPEAFAALILFRQAVEREMVTVALVREVTAFLEKARHNPGLRFQPSSG